MTVTSPTKQSLSKQFPHIAKQWHPKKNGSLNPSSVAPFSHKKVWWQCKRGHEWETRITNRSQGRGCPYCAGQKVGSDNNLLAVNPELAQQWHPKKNGDLKPDGVTVGSEKTVWWLCGKGHEWKARIGRRSHGIGCPYCAGRVATSDNNLLVVNPELARQWHPKKNGDLTPAQVMPGAHKSVWWVCGKGHEWKARIADRSRGIGCPYCAGQKVGSDNNLLAVNPELAHQWHPIKNGNLRPSDVTPGSHRKVWWQCKRGHEWETQIKNRSQGKGCPYCARRKLRH